MKNGYLIALCLALLSFAGNSYADDVRRGAQAYKLCAGCHGFRGEGLQQVNAPALGGQEPWYLERQLRNFKARIRGSQDDDRHGQAMAQMMLALDSEDDITSLVAYIGTLPAAQPKITISGNSQTGATLYAPCAACHGSSGEGNKALNAPALTTLDDWYQLAQLAKFKDGRRGAAANDTYGQQMAPMAAVLADEQAMRDVIAHITAMQ